MTSQLPPPFVLDQTCNRWRWFPLSPTVTLGTSPWRDQLERREIDSGLASRVAIR